MTKKKIEVDDSLDEKLTEKEALKQAADQGIFFRDWFTIGDDSKEYATHAAAVKACKGDEDKINSIVSHRAQKPAETE